MKHRGYYIDNVTDRNQEEKRGKGVVWGQCLERWRGTDNREITPEGQKRRVTAGGEQRNKIK